VLQRLDAVHARVSLPGLSEPLQVLEWTGASDRIDDAMPASAAP